MKTILITIAFLAAMNSYSQPVKDFRTLDSIWDTYSENENFSNLLWVQLNDFYFYEKLSNYISDKFKNDIEIVRFINAQKHNMHLNSNLAPLDYHFSPDVFFLYRFKNSTSIKIIYWDRTQSKVIDTVLNTDKQIFNYLLNINNYDGFKWDSQFAGRNLWIRISCYYGTGISISVYTPSCYFVKSVEEFWKYQKDEENVFFDDIQGDNQLIISLQSILNEVSTFFEFLDFCKLNVIEKALWDNINEYQKIRHTIFDVEAVDKREKEWMKQREPEKK